MILHITKLNYPYAFWDCFETAVHHNHAIIGVLNYLQAQLQEATLIVITGLAIIDTK